MPSGLASTPAPPTTSSWLFPPQTQEVQFDEKWSFVAKKQKHCTAAESRCGDCWDHVALDPEHRVVSPECCRIGRTLAATVSCGTSAEQSALRLTPENRALLQFGNSLGTPPGVHEAMTYFTLYSANFCWAVRTLREEVGPKRYRQRTPAMAAGLTDHVWPLEEWLLFPTNSLHKLPLYCSE